MLRRKRGINDGIWNRAVHSLTVVVMMVALAASLMPAPASQAEAAGCPPGQVLNTTGECVPLDLTLDVESEEDQPQIDLKLAGVVEVETPSPQLEPIVVTDEETPTLQLNSDVVTEEVTPTPQPDLGIVDTDVDGTPAADPELTDIPVIDPLSEEPGEGYVTVQKYACGSDPDVYQMTLAELQHDCDLSSQEFMFGLNVDGEDQATVQVTDANGSASWTVPNPTAVTINEAVPAGFGEPIVFCGNSLANLSLHDVTFGGAVSFPLAASEQFHCEWFNVQIGEDEDETGYGYVTVNKFDCGLDPDAYQKPLDGLLLDCSPMEDVAFGLTNEDDADQVIFSEQQVSDAAGIAVWTVPNPSTITISEVIPAGYGEPVVFCVAPQLDPDILPYSAAGGAISIPLAIAPGEQLYCDWFNVQIGEDEEEGGKIWIKKYSCENFPVQSPPDFIDISVFEYYECAELDGVPFAVSDDSVDLIGQSGDSGPGWLKLDGLVSGLVTVTEDIPAGYGEPFVYCATSTGENSYGTVVSVPVQSGAVQLKRDPDQSIFCEWLNIPTGDYEDSDGSIQINKYTCPTGYDLHASGANPYADCTDGANGIEFLLDGASSQVTGQVLFGAVRWEGLSTSTYTVTEDVPLDIGFVFVMSCEGNSIPMIQGFPLSTGPSLDIPLQSGDHIVCSWYNVPAPEGGTVTVIKYACVGEVFVSVDDCQIFEDGQGFALSHFNGSTWEEVAFGTTNAQGVLSFTGLAEGLYQVDEIDGTWCHAVATRRMRMATWWSVSARRQHCRSTTAASSCSRFHRRRTPTPGPAPSRIR